MDDQIRKRFFRLGLAIAVLGVLIIGQTAVYRHQRHQQADRFQTCISQVFGRLTTTLDARSKLTDPRTDSITTLIAGLLSAKTKADGDKVIATYEKTQRRLKAEAAAHPYPAFPDGKCAQ